MSRSSADLSSGNVRKLLFRLALPTIVSQLVNMLYNLVDRVFIGRIAPVETVGKLALTGVGVCLPIILIISAFASLMAAGGAPRASIAAGRGEPEESQRIMGNCFTMLIVTSTVLTLVFYKTENAFLWMLYQLCSGGVVLGAFFMATDYVTSPTTRVGQVLYGIGCGVLTVVFRYTGLFPEGVTYAILIMNAAVWLLERHTAPRIFGNAKGGKAG